MMLLRKNLINRELLERGGKEIHDGKKALRGGGAGVLVVNAGLSSDHD